MAVSKRDTRAIRRAVKAAGGQANLARALSLKYPNLVSQWVHGRRPVAPRHAIGIELATEGKVTRHEIAPEVFGAKARAVNGSESG